MSPLHTREEVPSHYPPLKETLVPKVKVTEEHIEASVWQKHDTQGW